MQAINLVIIQLYFLKLASVNYMHWGEMIEDRVDGRGEVALLTRNIVIRGEMLYKCPEANGNCDDYDHDTFGVLVKVCHY